MDVLYTTWARAVGGRAGHVVSDDGVLDLDLAKPPGLGGVPGHRGTNPEQLFAAGYAACFQSSIEYAARQRRLRDVETVVTAQVEIGRENDRGLALRIDLLIEVAGVADEMAQELVSSADQLCPYSKAIRGNVAVTKQVRTSAIVPE